MSRRAETALVATAGLLVFSRVFGLSVVLPGFVAYARGLPGATDLWVGTALGAYGLTLALMQWPMGWLSDRIGRRPVLLLGTLFFVAGSAWCALADSVGTLLAARLVQGLGAVSSTAMAMVGESVAPRRRTFAMAMVGIPAGLGFFLGLMTPGLLETVAFENLFWLAAALGLVAAAPVPFLRTASAHAATMLPQAQGASVMTLAAAGFALNFAMITVLFRLGLDGRTEGTRLLVPLLIALLVMGLASRHVDRRGLTWQPVSVGLVVLALGAVATVLPGDPAWRLGAAVFFSAHASLSAILPSQVSRIAGASGGQGHGIQNVVAYMGTFAAGVVAGLLARAPASNVAVVAAIAMAVGAASLWRLRMDSGVAAPA